MNTKYLLPAAFAATVHAFVLFGLTGKPPKPVAPPTEDAIDSIPGELIVALDPPPAESGEPDDPGPRGGPAGAPTLRDIPVIHPFTDEFFTRPSAKIDGPGGVTAIPAGWNLPGPGGHTAEVIDWRSLDHAPRARVQVAPDYPYEARSRKLAGTVVIEFVVDEAGNVGSPEVRAATSSVFVSAALRAVARWKFEPGTRHGRPVRFRMAVPIEFRVDD
ncbi:MAG TPA: TonB family protein [Opitutaceae bacterium]|nr:TonB family protein [Opitutaceae bacterium]